MEKECSGILFKVKYQIKQYDLIYIVLITPTSLTRPHTHTNTVLLSMK